MMANKGNSMNALGKWMGVFIKELKGFYLYF